MRWGSQINCREVAAGESLGRTVWYLLKAVNYLLKEAADAGGGTSKRQEEHWAELRRAARNHQCDECLRRAANRPRPVIFCAEHDPERGLEVEDGLYLMPDLRVLEASTGLRFDWSTGEVLADTEECAECCARRDEAHREQSRCDRALHRRNGRRTQTVIVSRGGKGSTGWSPTGLTRGRLRQERVAWAQSEFGDVDAAASAARSLVRSAEALQLRDLVDRYELRGSADPIP